MKRKETTLESPFLDKRTKLLPCQKERIILLRSEGLSQRKLAEIFNVSKRLIQFVLDPAKQHRNLDCRKERGGSKQYYDTEYHRLSMQKHRKRKREILKKETKALD